VSDADQIVLLALVRQAQLQRVATWMTAQLLAQLEGLDAEIVGLLFRFDPTAPVRPSTRAARINDFSAALASLLRGVFRDMSGDLEGWLALLRSASGDMEKAAWLAVADRVIDLADVPAGVVGKPTVLGTRVRDALDKVYEDLVYRTTSTVSSGTRSGQTASEIGAILRGEEPGKVKRPGAVERSAGQLETVIRTSVDDAANSAVLLGSSDGFNYGWQHVSVLDNRTTEICRARAWKRWDAEYKPIGHKLKFEQPPLHYNCRSRVVMLDLDEPAPEQINLGQLLDRLAPAVRDELFGAERVRLWRAKKLGDTDLIRQAGRPLSLDDFAKLAKAPLPLPA